MSQRISLLTHVARALSAISEAKTGAKSSGKAPQSSAVPQAVPTKSAGGGKEASQGNDLLVLVGGVLLVVAGVRWFTRSKK